MNKIKLFWVFLLTVLFTTAYAQDPKYPSELTVAKTGTSNYKTIQEAINSIRDFGEQTVTIHIKNGTYNEKLIIPSWKTNIKLIGESKEGTIITNGDYSGKPNPGNTDAFGLAKFSTYTSYTVLVQGDDVSLENLTIVNSAGAVGQAVALHVEGDRFVARFVNIFGHQDTLFATKEGSRQFYQNCFITGTTDFIFGKATAVFQTCVIKSLSNSYVTAASTSPRQQYGFVFLDCKLIADSGVTKVFLGRPWRPFAKTVFINCDMAAHILPEGWNPWTGDKMFPDKTKTVYYGEYKSTGAGAKPKARAIWSKQLSNKEAKQYTMENILAGADKWKMLLDSLKVL